MKNTKTDIGKTILFVLSAVLVFAILVLIISLMQPVSFKMSCDIDKITYGVNQPAKCYIPGVTSWNCPMPGKIQCTVEGQAPLFLLNRLGE